MTFSVMVEGVSLGFGLAVIFCTFLTFFLFFYIKQLMRK